ncbi:MAG: hypothetical protein Q8O17_03225 [Candidatus Methanoperedens sp.]|nr:hypothetical protein [Candidatus Methanoperedens sp.]
MTPQNYIRQLEENIIQLTAEKKASLQRSLDLEIETEKLKKEKKQLEKENEELKKRLLFYENSNTPPSARTIKKADKTSTEDIPIPKKRGAPNGHKGATRPTKEPDEIIDVISDHCEKCGSSNIEQQEKYETSVIEDIPPPQKIKTTQYNCWEVKCNDCGHQSISKHPDCPKTGNFGVFLLVYIVMLKFHLRGVITCLRHYLSKKPSQTLTPNRSN